MLLNPSIYFDLAVCPCQLMLGGQTEILAAIKAIHQLVNGEFKEYDQKEGLGLNTNCILVVEQDKLLGTFSQSDVVHLVAQQKDLSKLCLADVMAGEVNKIRRSQLLDFEIMLNYLQNSQCEYLPVVDDFDQVLGVISQCSILFAKNRLSEDTMLHIKSQSKAVLNAIPDLIYRISIDGTYLDCFSSDYVEDLLPNSFDPIDKNIVDILPKDLADLKLTAIQKAIATGEMQTFEQQWHMGEKIQYEEVQIVRVSDQEALTIIRNISDRKQAEEALRESEMRFRSIFDTAAVGISLASIDGKHLDTNQALRQMLGYSETELRMLSFQEITHPDDLEKDLYNYQKLLDGEIDSFNIEKRFRHKDGRFIWTLLSVSLVVDVQGEPMYDIALIQNINELKNIQQELHDLNHLLELRIQQRTADLADSEARKRAILNAIPDLLIRLTNDGTCLDCILPRSPHKNEFLPIKQHISEVLSPSSVTDQIAASKMAIATGEVQIYEHKLQKHGLWVYEEVRVSPCGNDEVLVLVRNISDRKQAEEALKLSNEKLVAINVELERVTRLKDEFLAAMSHELRTPLNAVIGISEGLLDQVFGELNARQINYLKTIHKSGEHLLEVINDILDVSKIESGNFELDLGLASVNALCESSLSFVRYQATQKNIQLNFVDDKHAPSTIAIDERRMRQVLINLLSNAVKFTPKDGVVNLEVKLVRRPEFSEKSEGELHFAIADTGIGIASDDIPKLFQPFIQISSSLSRQYAGTGLGLNLVKKIVNLHGGKITVESKLGEGSCFTVVMPIVKRL